MDDSLDGDRLNGEHVEETTVQKTNLWNGSRPNMSKRRLKGRIRVVLPRGSCCRETCAYKLRADHVLSMLDFMTFYVSETCSVLTLCHALSAPVRFAQSTEAMLRTLQSQARFVPESVKVIWSDLRSWLCDHVASEHTTK